MLAEPMRVWFILLVSVATPISVQAQAREAPVPLLVEWRSALARTLGTEVAEVDVSGTEAFTRELRDERCRQDLEHPEGRGVFMLVPRRVSGLRTGVRCPGLLAFALADRALRRLLPLVLREANWAEEAARFEQLPSARSVAELVPLSDAARALHGRASGARARTELGAEVQQRLVTATRIGTHVPLGLSGMRDDVDLVFGDFLRMAEVAHRSSPARARAHVIEALEYAAWLAREALRR
jgi:hypothetical protein